MKLFKSVFTAAIACAVIVSMGICAFAYVVDATYSIDIPEDFISSSTTTWKNDDGDIIIELAFSENTSNVKVNPNEAGESYLSLVEENVTQSLTDVEGVASELISVQSGLMELGEHDAIRVSLAKKYSFENGDMTVYRVCYLFETQNYIHSVVVTGDENIEQFADELIKTFKINDEAVALREEETDNSVGTIIKGALLGALIGAAVGVALALAKKLTGRKEKSQQTEPPFVVEFEKIEEIEEVTEVEEAKTVEEVTAAEETTEAEEATETEADKEPVED